MLHNDALKQKTHYKAFVYRSFVMSKYTTLLMVSDYSFFNLNMIPPCTFI